MEDFSLCRTCLSQDSLNPIFTDSTDNSEYTNAIFITTGLKIEANDGLPQEMCTNCVTFLNSYMKFRKKCKDTETTLINIKRKMHKHKIDNIQSFILELALDDDVKTENALSDIDNDKPLKHFIDKTEPIYLNNIDSDTDFHTKSTGETDNDQEFHHDSTLQDRECDNGRLDNTEVAVPLYEILDTNKNRVVCKICQKELSVRSIDAHMARSHPGADGTRVKCDLCDNYISKAKLNRHMVLMHGPGTFKCGYCKSEHGSRESLIEHVVTCAAKKKKRKPSETSRELQECDVCHKTMQRASLRMHKMIKHAGLGPVCEHCGLRFGNKHRLSEHYRAKHGYEKFRCSYCDFRSASVLAMRNHERRHRGEKPFVCESCGAKFHAAYLLAQHRHCHRTERPNKCDQCPATFKANNSLHSHKLTCHSSAPYSCGVCGRAYRCRHYAARHARLAHQGEGEGLKVRGDIVKLQEA